MEGEPSIPGAERVGWLGTQDGRVRRLQRLRQRSLALATAACRQHQQHQVRRGAAAAQASPEVSAEEERALAVRRHPALTPNRM